MVTSASPQEGKSITAANLAVVLAQSGKRVVLAARMDGTLLVVDSGSTRRGPVQRTKEALTAVGARLLGVAMNRFSSREGGYYQYYYSSDEGPRRHRTASSVARLFKRNGHSAHAPDVASDVPVARREVR